MGSGFRHPSSTAHRSNRHSGWAEITHPFHPQRGQRFRILKTRRVSGVETLLLGGVGGGPNSVPLEWTDRAEPSVYAGTGVEALVFDFGCLLTVSALLEAVERGKQELDK